MRFPACLVFVVVLHAVAPAAESVDALIAQLASDDFDARETASIALREHGVAIWPKLETALTTADAEMAARIAQIGETLHPLPVRDCEAIAGAMDMFLSNNASERAQGLDQLLSLGAPGIRLARQILSARDVQLHIDTSISTDVLRLGEVGEAKARVTNAGGDGFWVYRAPAVRLAAHLSANFNGVEPGVNCCGGGRVMIRRSGYINPIYNWAYCMPGTVATAVEDLLPERCGIYRAHASFSLARNSRIEPRLPDHCNRTIALWINSDLPAEMQSVHAQQQFFVLPNFEFPIVDRRLGMDATGPAAAITDGVLPVELSVYNRGIEPRELQLERTFMEMAWYVIVNADGRPVKWGNLESVLDQCDEPMAPHDSEVNFRRAYQPVAPDAPFHVSLPIPMPTDAGTYSVLFGYEVDSSGSDWRYMRNFNWSGTPYVRDDIFLDGQLYARIENVRVEAPAKK